MIKIVNFIIFLMILKKNIQLYQIYFLDLMKQQMNVLIVEIHINQKDIIIQNAIIMEYLIS